MKSFIGQIGLCFTVLTHGTSFAAAGTSGGAESLGKILAAEPAPIDQFLKTYQRRRSENRADSSAAASSLGKKASYRLGEVIDFAPRRAEDFFAREPVPVFAATPAMKDVIKEEKQTEGPAESVRIVVSGARAQQKVRAHEMKLKTLKAPGPLKGDAHDSTPAPSFDVAQGPNLAPPEDLFNLDGLLKNHGHGSLNASMPFPPATPTGADADGEESASQDPAVDEETSEEALAILNDDPRSHEFERTREELSYRQVKLQLIDDRSQVAQKRIYPAIGVRVSIVGLEFRGETDRRGEIMIPNLPRGARMLVRFEDAMGRYLPSIAELFVDDAAKGTKTFRLTRHQAFTAYEWIVQDSALGSLCGTLVESRETLAPVTGLTLSVDDPEAEGPYFFNRFGFLDARLKTSGPDGRYCFFNVEPGPVAITVYNGKTPLLTSLVGIHAGFHSEEDLVFSEEYELGTHLASLVTAHEQLGSDALLANSLKLIDAIDVVPLGTGRMMAVRDEGDLYYDEELYFHQKRAFAVTSASEFETALYSYKPMSENVTPLLPRGFIEDMALYAQVSYDPFLGSVVFEHNHLNGQTGEELEVKLLDEHSQEVGEGWYYADAPVTKAIFFNVPPGRYSLMVMSRDGSYWISAETVFVFNETVSSVMTGSSLRRKDFDRKAATTH